MGHTPKGYKYFDLSFNMAEVAICSNGVSGILTRTKLRDHQLVSARTAPVERLLSEGSGVIRMHISSKWETVV